MLMSFAHSWKIDPIDFQKGTAYWRAKQKGNKASEGSDRIYFLLLKYFFRNSIWNSSSRVLDKREKEANACKLAKEMLWHICHRFRFILIWNKRWMALTFITTSDIIVNASMAFSFSSPSFLSGFLWISHQQEKRGERHCCRPSIHITKRSHHLGFWWRWYFYQSAETRKGH